MSQVDYSLNIKVIDKKEFDKLCKNKNLETYAFEWNSFKDTGQSQSRNIAIGLLDTLANNIEKKDSIIIKLPAKYLNFQDVFSKTEANKLLKHNKHDMSINFEDEKIPFISPVYNISRLELQAMYEYINKILAKDFIILFKSPVRAFIMFTKKKNGGLRFCIDYYSINAITKKNKHLIPLVYSLLNMLSKA